MAFTISMNRVNKHGFIENYLEPLVLDNPLSIRLCGIFETPNSFLPYLTQIDIFSSKITISLMESQMVMIMDLLNSINKRKSVNRVENNDENTQSNYSISTTPGKFLPLLV